MINKNKYLEFLKQILGEHYNIMKSTNKVFSDRQHFIDGYLAAANALEIFEPNDLRKFIDKLHYEIFGISVKERKQTMTFNRGTEEEYLEIPAYMRKGIRIDF